MTDKAMSVSALLKQLKKLTIRQDSLLKEFPTGQNHKTMIKHTNRQSYKLRFMLRMCLVLTIKGTKVASPTESFFEKSCRAKTQKTWYMADIFAAFVVNFLHTYMNFFYFSMHFQHRNSIFTFGACISQQSFTCSKSTI